MIPVTVLDLTALDHDIAAGITSIPLEGLCIDGRGVFPIGIENRVVVLRHFERVGERFSGDACNNAGAFHAIGVDGKTHGRAVEVVFELLSHRCLLGVQCAPGIRQAPAWITVDKAEQKTGPPATFLNHRTGAAGRKAQQ